MEFLLYASAIIAAVSLLLIAIFVVITLKSAKQTMGDISETLKRVDSKIGGITKKSEELLEKTNQIAYDAELKLQSFEGLSTTAKDLKQTTNYMDQSLKQISDQVSHTPKKYEDLMQQTNVLTEIFSRLYYGFKREKEKRR